MGFTTPSAVALALDLAINAVDQSRVLRPKVEESETVSPFGPSTSVTHESTEALYDYFEQCMIALTFSFQALEAFCNETISYKVTDHYLLKQRKRVRKLNAEELERFTSTEDKLGIVIPDLLNVPTPKRGRLWHGFTTLKELRDATIHIKSRDSAPRVLQPGDLDESTLFVLFLDADVSSWPKAALAMIAYFDDAHLKFSWVDHVAKTLGVRVTKPITNQPKNDKPPRSKRHP